MPWHRFKTGRMKVLNHCFIEGKKRSLHQRIQKTQEVKCSQLLPGVLGGGQVCTWIQTKSVSSLFG